MVWKALMKLQNYNKISFLHRFQNTRIALLGTVSEIVRNLRTAQNCRFLKYLYGNFPKITKDDHFHPFKRMKKSHFYRNLNINVESAGICAVLVCTSTWKSDLEGKNVRIFKKMAKYLLFAHIQKTALKEKFRIFFWIWFKILVCIMLIWACSA